MIRTATLTAAVLSFGSVASAGVHYSGEGFRDLPAKWSGFLPDHRALRAVAVPQLPGPLRDQYADAALKLEGVAKTRDLTADEAADLGALYFRLGRPANAVDILRPAARAHPTHFRLTANLGAAWHLAGDLNQAAAALEDAVRLAPQRWQAAEAAHLKLVRLRAQERKGTEPTGPDALFPNLRSADALATTQALALWFPADGRLVWLLADVALAAGDVRTAAALYDGCVTEYNLAAPAVRTARQVTRAQVDALDAASKHTDGRGSIAFASNRALLRGFDPTRLPPIKPIGTNPLPWAVVAETEIGPKGKPTFLDYLDQLDGKTVTLAGYITPAGAPGGELTGFLFTEFPVGCWFCEVPGPSRVIAVTLTDGLTTEPTRTVIKVTGILKLNRADPEGFPVTLTKATLGAAD